MPTREELLAKVRRAGALARQRGTQPARPNAKKRAEGKDAAAATAAALKPETALEKGEALLREFNPDTVPADVMEIYRRDLYETCGGDAAAFCRMHGVSRSMIPSIEAAVAKLKLA
jgi:hypothetical protein